MQPKLPSKKSIILVWALLVGYLTYLFLYKSTADFFQLNYNWDVITVIENLGEVTVDSLSHDYVVLKNDLKEINNINLLHTFLIEQEEKSYFRASTIAFSEKQILFSGVKWINGMPKKQMHSPTFQILNLPVIQNGTKTITTIGDSQMLWQDGRDFRKNLHLKNKDLVFKGNYKDVNGYPHEAGIYNTSNDILKMLPDISSTSHYILFFGAHDKRTNMETLKAEVCEILNTLTLRQQTKKIVVLNLPPSPVKEFNDFNKAFNKVLSSCVLYNETVKTISLYEELGDQSDYLMEDNVHLNERGLKVAVKLLNKALK
ncbi:MAG: SGNH/GDSL hydrolase family protein [Flavobacteriales bacterium]|nr:SGNH/GDSL hydrolase family protein [Flavobacteriales bacterium]